MNESSKLMNCQNRFNTKRNTKYKIKEIRTKTRVQPVSEDGFGTADDCDWLLLEDE